MQYNVHANRIHSHNVRVRLCI